MTERGCQDTCHKMSPKHSGRYADEFVGCHEVREADAVDQMAGVVVGMTGKRLRRGDLIAADGLESGAR